MTAGSMLDDDERLALEMYCAMAGQAFRPWLRSGDRYANEVVARGVAALEAHRAALVAEDDEGPRLDHTYKGPAFRVDEDEDGMAANLARPETITGAFKVVRRGTTWAVVDNGEASTTRWLVTDLARLEPVA